MAWGPPAFPGGIIFRPWRGISGCWPPTSPAKTASRHHVDNRVQQRVGAAARALGYLQAEVAMGIPVNISGKSIYFDRPAPARH
jgi:hypothetical protein